MSTRSAKVRPFDLSGGIWRTQDPFQFCAYHNDVYPAGDPKTGAVADKSKLRGRAIGSDFSMKDGWSMYHGTDVPGFPRHPHYGFETISIVKRGLVDHSDSLGCGGRFGNGDVQWMTAGDGVQHCEMFPLLSQKKNPLDFLQLWLNLPARSKRVPPHYAMLWREDLHKLRDASAAPNVTTVADPTVIPSKDNPLSPPPNSWAADPNNHVVIKRIELAAGAKHTIEPLAADVEKKDDITRTLYFFNGKEAFVASGRHEVRTGFFLDANESVEVEAVGAPAEFLLLQGRKINEPTAHQGPFFGTNHSDLREAMTRYHMTDFGGWKWQSDDPVHDLKAERFSTYPDGSRDDRPL